MIQQCSFDPRGEYAKSVALKLLFIKESPKLHSMATSGESTEVMCSCHTFSHWGKQSGQRKEYIVWRNAIKDTSKYYGSYYMDIFY